MKLVAFASVAGALLLMLAAVAPSSAAVVDTQYIGVTTDFADFALNVPEGGSAITGLEIGKPNASFTLPCFDSGTIALTDAVEVLKNAINGSGQAERSITDPGTGEPRILRLSGRFFAAGSAEEGIATGAVSISSAGPNSEGVTCNPRSFGWAVAARTHDDAPRPQTTFRGQLTAGPSIESLRDGGTASFSVTGDGAAITRFALTPTQECATTDLGATTATLTTGRASFSEEGNVSTAIPVVGKYRLMVAASRAVGAFYIDRNKVGCLPLAGFFIATPVSAPTATPTPTPASTPALTPTPSPQPGATGSIVSGAIPLPGGVGLVVWGGGGSEQLLSASGCPRTSAAFWASNASGGFDAYVPGTAIAVVNATWNTRFASGIPSGTALLGRCA